MAKGPEALCESYAKAHDGESLAAHYLFPYVSFTLGHVHSFETREDGVKGCREQLERFDKVGLGRDLRMPSYKVEGVSPHSALCHVTWEIHPPEGVEGFTWTNIYGYRLRENGEEGFEFNISDNEIAALLARFPHFFS